MKRMLPLAAASAFFAPIGADAAHPLVSDDTGTQGNANWQIELNAEQTSKQEETGRQQLWNSTLTRGFGERVDLYVNAPYTHLQTRSDENGSGFGDVEVGMKWRFLERGPFTLALKPTVSFPTGDDQRGLGTGRVGAGATMLAQVDVARFSFLANAGITYQPNRQDDLTSIWQVSGAAIYRATDTFQIVVDVGTSRNAERNASANPAFVIAGAIYSPKPWLDLDIGYRRGLNDQTYDHSVMAGVTARW
ncbi:transporter [Burkholderia sp. Ac-20353]|uniref:transporter n=1 Tax=Burkholderia sp. Ac-20353 TaxID=2703894 RepID=UPI00197B4B74|nr:transporter [Burkholderia sp. Ac-20353]MBN3787039.1 transporter [Burkholderia sp. Ac-20353]